MASKHTPGPWTSSDEFMAEIVDADGRPVALSANRDASDANARLMAAAPDLLAACEDALSFLGEYATPRHPRAELSIKCRAAISKATGEA